MAIEGSNNYIALIKGIALFDIFQMIGNAFGLSNMVKIDGWLFLISSWPVFA